MNPFEHLNTELQKIKRINIVLISCLVGMLLLVVFLFVMIQQKNKQLEEVSALLSMKNNLIESQEDLLSALDSINVEDANVGKAVQMIKDFVQEETPVAAANTTRTKNGKTIQSNTTLSPNVMALFSKNEGKRSDARNNLLHTYKSDPQLVPALLNYAADKTDYANKEAIMANYLYSGSIITRKG